MSDKTYDIINKAQRWLVALGVHLKKHRLWGECMHSIWYGLPIKH